MAGRRLDPELIQSWRELGAEVCISFGRYSFWLVPEYTDRNRIEMTPEDFSLIHESMETFEGAKIVGVKRLQRNRGQAPEPKPVDQEPPKPVSQERKKDDHPF